MRTCRRDNKRKEQKKSLSRRERFRLYFYKLLTESPPYTKKQKKITKQKNKNKPHELSANEQCTIPKFNKQRDGLNKQVCTEENNKDTCRLSTKSLMPEVSFPNFKDENEKECHINETYQLTKEDKVYSKFEQVKDGTEINNANKEITSLDDKKKEVNLCVGGEQEVNLNTECNKEVNLNAECEQEVNLNTECNKEVNLNAECEQEVNLNTECNKDLVNEKKENSDFYSKRIIPINKIKSIKYSD